VNCHFQIVRSRRSPEGEPALPFRPSRWQRIKIFCAGITLLLSAVLILVVAITVGLILATVVLMILLVMVAGLILRARRNRGL